MGIKCPKCHLDNPETASFCSGCGTRLFSSKNIDVAETVEVPKEELTTGSTFANKYQIIEELGKGGMGKVYKALDTEVHEKIAIKLIKPEIASDKNTIERFRNELKIARKIRHKNVCQMYDFNKEEGLYYINMEYVSGEDLKTMIRIQVDFEKGLIRVENTKSGKNRHIHINSDLARLLKRLKSKEESREFVFVNPDTGKPYLDLKKAFKGACKKAGIEDLRFHDLRHTFASRLVENGVDLITVKDLLGHSTVKMTERYTHPNQDLKKKAVEVLVKKKKKGAKKSEILA